MPLAVGLGGGVVRHQGLQQRSLGLRFGQDWVGAGGAKQRRHLAVGVKGKKLGQVHGGGRIEPAQGQ